MSRFFKKQGFTLIELMVVIVIIGVLASLAIPRFTEASAKAKMSEAPLVIKSFENGVLAAALEKSPTELAAMKFEEVVVDAPKDSKWWNYDEVNGAASSKLVGSSAYEATAKGKMGKFESGWGINAQYYPASGTVGDCFYHSAGTSAVTVAKQMVPQFMGNICTTS